MSAIRKFAAFVAEASRAHDDDAVAISRRAVIDTLGCMFAGANKPVAHNTLSACRAWGSGNAPVVGSDVRLAPPRTPWIMTITTCRPTRTPAR